MAQEFGYMVDLWGHQFDDLGDDTTTTFQAMPYGTYSHPIYGKIDLTPERAQRFAANVNEGIRGQDLDIDYDHKQHSGEAAGWVKSAEARPDGLYLTVEWTKNAFTKIKEKAYRYFSPEFKDEWKHPSTGQVYKDVLFGGGITNRPFLKGILPLNLSELTEQKEGTGMDPKELRKLLGLPEDATDEQVNTALQERLKEPEGNEQGKEEEAESGTKQPELQVVGLSEEVIKRLTEGDNPEVKALAEAVSTLQKTVQTQSVALQLAETNATVQRFTEGNDKGIALSAAGAKQLSDILLNSPKPLGDQVVKLMETILGEGGTVQLGEKGGSIPHSGGENEDAADKFNGLVKKCMEEDKLDYGQATERVAVLHPDLFESYRQGSYAFKEV